MFISKCVALFSVMGKAEGSVQKEEWHGHVTAVTVAPEYRRLGLAAKLMSNLEEISEKYFETLNEFHFLSRGNVS